MAPTEILARQHYESLKPLFGDECGLLLGSESPREKREALEKLESGAWKAVTEAKSIRTASDTVMLKYEKPATTTEAAKSKRAAYANKFYFQFAKQTDLDPQPAKKMVVATENVRIRAGDSKEYVQVGSLNKGQSMEWVATSNGFHAVRMKDRIGWVSGDFSNVVS